MVKTTSLTQRPGFFIVSSLGESTPLRGTQAAKDFQGCLQTSHSHNTGETHVLSGEPAYTAD